MNELALFAGAGGGILGGKLLGWRTVCAVEFDDYARRVLMSRQDDGCLEPFPIWDDVRTFDGKPWAGLVDVVSGGFPCQDISAAGKGAGIDGARSGLWGEMARIIREVGPRYVFVENSPMLTSRGLGRVLGDLAALGYDAAWGVLGAVDAGAPHKRERIWIVAHAVGLQSGQRHESPMLGRWTTKAEQARVGDFALADSERSGLQGSAGCGMHSARGAAIEPSRCGADVPDADLSGCEEQRRTLADGAEHEAAECGDWWAAEPDVGRMAHGVASRVDRLRGLGNGQVPAVAALAFSILKQRIEKKQHMKTPAKPKADKSAAFIQICEALGLAKPATEHQFEPLRRWRFDYAWPEAKIALEVEGGVWSGGRHTTGKGFVGDMAKYNRAAVLGWRILRVQPKDLITLATVQMVKEARCA